VGAASGFAVGRLASFVLAGQLGGQGNGDRSKFRLGFGVRENSSTSSLDAISD